MIDHDPVIIKPCIICGKPANAIHHCFHQTKRNREKYGWLLDLEFNKSYICPGCHTSHSAVGIPRFNDQEFLSELRKYLKERGIYA